MTTKKATKQFETMDAVLSAALKAGKSEAECRNAGFLWIDQMLEAEKLSTLEARRYEGQLIDYGRDWPR